MRTAVSVVGAVIVLFCIVGFFRSLSDRPSGDSDEGHGFQPGGAPPSDHSPFDGAGAA
jgi:hypothetical protein